MIKKYIENTEEVRQRLIRMLMDDASDMCRYQRDIYMYIDEDGQARLEWFINPDGNSWIDDDHILLHVCRQHFEGIEDNIESVEMLADLIDFDSIDALVDAVYQDHAFKDDISRDDITYADCITWALSVYGDRLRAWYDACIEAAESDYADQADAIMIQENRYRLEHAYRLDVRPCRESVIVWLFVLDAEDQFRFELQHGGDSNG